MNLVRKNQSRGYDEADLEFEGAEAGNAAEDQQSDEESPIYNPKNLPLGWDGRPIPYWLYKLHGLGIEYKCEICGNTSYWGRKAFEDHFQGWRHSYGMRYIASMVWLDASAFRTRSTSRKSHAFRTQSTCTNGSRSSNSKTGSARTTRRSTKTPKVTSSTRRPSTISANKGWHDLCELSFIK